MPRKITKFISFLICFCFIFEQSGFAQILPPAQIAGLSSPPLLRYLSVNSANPFNYFNFLMDKGNEAEGSLERSPELVEGRSWGISGLNSEAKKLINYFFLGITLPSESFWVNLRPDEPGRITSEELSKTDLGRTLLEQDLQLKKDVAKYLHPTNPRGKEFWEKLYAGIGKDKVKKVEITTSNRVWIVPDEAVIIETEDGAFVASAKLKILLENDYLKGLSPKRAVSDFQNTQSLSERLMKEIIIPPLTEEINKSPAYAPLRQIYQSLILAEWFKRKHKTSNSVYSHCINKGYTKGLESEFLWSKQAIWQEYLKSYKNGEYKLEDTLFGLRRMYWSGGMSFANLSHISGSPIGVAASGLNAPNEDVLKIISISARESSDGPAIAPQQKIALKIMAPEELNNLIPVLTSGSAVIDEKPLGNVKATLVSLKASIEEALSPEKVYQPKGKSELGASSNKQGLSLSELKQRDLKRTVPGDIESSASPMIQNAKPVDYFQAGYVNLVPLEISREIIDKEFNNKIVSDGGKEIFERWAPEKVKEYTTEEYAAGMRDSSGHLGVHITTDALSENIVRQGFLVPRLVAEMMFGLSKEFSNDKIKNSPENYKNILFTPSYALHFSMDKPSRKLKSGDKQDIAFIASAEALLENKAFIHSPFINDSKGNIEPSEDWPITGFSSNLLDKSYRFNINELGIMFIPVSKKDKFEKIFAEIGNRIRVYYYEENTLAEGINAFLAKYNITFKGKPMVGGEIRAIEDIGRVFGTEHSVGTGEGSVFVVHKPWASHLKIDLAEPKSAQEYLDYATNLLSIENAEVLNDSYIEEAKKLAFKAIELNPQAGLAYWVLAKTYNPNTESVDTKRVQLEKAITLGLPKDYEILARIDLTQIYEEIGQIDKAKIEWQHLTQLLPERKEYIENQIKDLNVSKSGFIQKQIKVLGNLSHEIDTEFTDFAQKVDGLKARAVERTRQGANSYQATLEVYPIRESIRTELWNASTAAQHFINDIANKESWMPKYHYKVEPYVRKIRAQRERIDERIDSKVSELFSVVDETKKELATTIKTLSSTTALSSASSPLDQTARTERSRSVSSASGNKLPISPQDILNNSVQRVQIVEELLKEIQGDYSIKHRENQTGNASYMNSADIILSYLKNNFRIENINLQEITDTRILGINAAKGINLPEIPAAIAGVVIGYIKMKENSRFNPQGAALDVTEYANIDSGKLEKILINLVELSLSAKNSDLYLEKSASSAMVTDILRIGGQEFSDEQGKTYRIRTTLKDSGTNNLLIEAIPANSNVNKTPPNLELYFLGLDKENRQIIFLQSINTESAGLGESAIGKELLGSLSKAVPEKTVLVFENTNLPLPENLIKASGFTQSIAIKELPVDNALINIKKPNLVAFMKPESAGSQLKNESATSATGSAINYSTFLKQFNALKDYTPAGGTEQLTVATLTQILNMDKPQIKFFRDLLYGAPDTAVIETKIKFIRNITDVVNKIRAGLEKKDIPERSDIISSLNGIEEKIFVKTIKGSISSKLNPDEKIEVEKMAALFLPYKELEKPAIERLIEASLLPMPKDSAQGNFDFDREEHKTIGTFINSLLDRKVSEVVITTFGPGEDMRELKEMLRMITDRILEGRKPAAKFKVVLQAVDMYADSLLESEKQMKSHIESLLPVTEEANVTVEYRGYFGDIKNKAIWNNMVLPSDIFLWRHTWVGQTFDMEYMKSFSRLLWERLNVNGAIIVAEVGILSKLSEENTLEVATIKTRKGEPPPQTIASSALEKNSNFTIEKGGIDLSKIELTLKDESYISSLNPADVKVLRAAKALKDQWDSLSLLYVHEIMLLMKDGITKDIQNKELLENVLQQLQIKSFLDPQAVQFLNLIQSQKPISEIKVSLLNQ